MFAHCGNNPVHYCDPAGHNRINTLTMMTDTGYINHNPKPSTAVYYAGSYQEFNGQYGKGTYIEVNPPKVTTKASSRTGTGLSLGSAKAGVAAIGGNDSNWNWNVSVVTAAAKAEISSNYVGGKLGASLVSGEVGHSITLPLIDKQIYIGVEGQAFAIGIEASYDKEKHRLKVGVAEVFGGAVVIGWN